MKYDFVTFTTLWATSAGDKLKVFFLFFSRTGPIS